MNTVKTEKDVFMIEILAEIRAVSEVILKIKPIQLRNRDKLQRIRSPDSSPLVQQPFCFQGL